MAFGIKIFEKDEFIFSLLKSRLGILFPEAYIMRFEKNIEDDAERFCDFEKILYDNRQFTLEVTGYKDAIPIYGTDGKIDCNRIAAQINSQSGGGSRTKGILTLLFPFAGIRQRENFIRNELTDPYDYDCAIRLDFVNGLRSASADTNMSGLMEDAAGKHFEARDILKYVNPDGKGYLTPGGTKDPDECFDAGPTRAEKILVKAKELTRQNDMPTSVLGVIEVYRSSDMIRLAKQGDRVIVLSRADTRNMANFVSDMNKNISPEIQVEFFASDTPEDEQRGMIS